MKVQVQDLGKLRREVQIEIPFDDIRGEYQQVKDPEATDKRFATYYVHAKTRQTFWREPDWAEIWNKRRKRSELIERLAVWDKYWDDVQQLPFWFNMKEGEYTWYDPLGEFAVQEEDLKVEKS